MAKIGMVDVEICELEQAKYLVHGISDLTWTDDIEEVILYLTEELRKIGKEPREQGKGFCADCGEHCDYC